MTLYRLLVNITFGVRDNSEESSVAITNDCVKP
jgi:hypothetical protein